MAYFFLNVVNGYCALSGLDGCCVFYRWVKPIGNILHPLRGLDYLERFILSKSYELHLMMLF